MDVADFEESARKRGRTYFRQGRVWHRLRTGDRLEARVLGNEGRSYHVTYDLATGEGFCHCPVGARGGCKHVAALLWAWESAPESFLPAAWPEGMDARVAHFLSASFEARYLLARALADSPPGLEVYEPIFATLRTLARRGSAKAAELFHLTWREAQVLEAEARLAIELGLARVLVEASEEPLDFWGSAVDLLTESLKRWPEAARDFSLRSEAAEVLLGLYFRTLADDPELGETAAMALLRLVDEGLADRLAARVRSRLERSRGREAAALGGLYEALLERAGDRLEGDRREALLRQAGRWRELLGMWLDRGALSRAISTLAEEPGLDPVEASLAFIERGLAEEARRALLRRPGRHHDLATLVALWRVNEALGDARGVAEALEALFLRTDSPDAYRALKETSRRLGDWAVRRARLRQRLLREGRWGLVFSLDLEEEDYAAAAGLWPVVRDLLVEHNPWLVGPFVEESERLFQGLLAEDPARAAGFARELVTFLIELRARHYYARAARIARAVRDAFGEGSAEACWVYRLAERYPRLRALREELAKVGLDKSAGGC